MTTHEQHDLTDSPDAVAMPAAEESRMDDVRAEPPQHETSTGETLLPATTLRICVRDGPAFRPRSLTIRRNASRKQTTWFPMWWSNSRRDSPRRARVWKNNGREARTPPPKTCGWP